MGLSRCVNAQKFDSDKQVIVMLTNFYTEYNHIWTIKPPLNPHELENKIDTLLMKYCTLKFRHMALNAFKNHGQDILTNGLGSVDLNENLKIERYSADSNIFVVSFKATNSNAAGHPTIQDVILHVSVILEGSSYKINEVN
jgi:hypothetical protein